LVHTLKYVPEVVKLEGWAGDTLTVAVKAPTVFIAGRVYSAQVRSSFTSPVVDASLVFVAPTEVDGPAAVYLRSEDSRRLAEQGSARPGSFTSTDGAAYEGVWDCQLAPEGGGDPTITVAVGPVRIFNDVTRL
jgi:hypothetical protein